ncbi:MAG TPA: hypothetical protein VJ860_01310 [Polyangia bacterium]|nr:hypothetical protein [Polyangia bacterium]
MESEHEDPNQAAQEVTGNEEAAGAKGSGLSRGKIFLGLIVAAIIIFAGYFATRRISPNSAAILRTAAADITLVTSDRTDVACVSQKGFQSYHCGFSTEIVNWQGDEQNKLAPYYTLDRHLYLIPGLFLEPAILARYQSEPPNKPREQLRRFTAHCQIKIIGKLAGVRTHWVVNTAWGNPEDIEVGTVSGCKIDG